MLAKNNDFFHASVSIFIVMIVVLFT